ncbi:VanZ family protein [Nitratifractor sp.]|uniref:VanZ family protein n=1 Tax=Nitratifractor sp. TaxID=2268144 RepID=UPI0025CC0C8D|nr:VanZ family protein [Nitratifractor sp.]
MSVHRLPTSIPWRSLFWSALALITFVALMPWTQELPKPFQWSDKLNHFAAFVVLVWSLKAAYPLKNRQAWLWMLAYGAAIESIQYFLPWRSAEWADLAVDALAALTGLLLYPFFERSVICLWDIMPSYKKHQQGK